MKKKILFLMLASLAIAGVSSLSKKYVSLIAEDVEALTTVYRERMIPDVNTSEENKVHGYLYRTVSYDEESTISHTFTYTYCFPTGGTYTYPVTQYETCITTVILNCCMESQYPNRCDFAKNPSECGNVQGYKLP